MPRWLALAFAFSNCDVGELAELGAGAPLEPAAFAWWCGFGMDFARPCPSA